MVAKLLTQLLRNVLVLKVYLCCPAGCGCELGGNRHGQMHILISLTFSWERGAFFVLLLLVLSDSSLTFVFQLLSEAALKTFQVLLHSVQSKIYPWCGPSEINPALWYLRSWAHSVNSLTQEPQAVLWIDASYWKEQTVHFYWMDLLALVLQAESWWIQQ